MAGWFGLSPATPDAARSNGLRTNPGGGGGGLVTRSQLTNPPAPLTDRREQVPVVVKDLHPVGDQNTYHTLADFSNYNPGIAPGTMDLCFFGGDSITSKATRWTGVFSGLLGRASRGDWSHVGVAYVGQDGVIALFEAVRESDTLHDVLTGTVGKPGVRLVRLSERVKKYARNGEFYKELPNRDRVVKVGVMQFRMPGVPAEQHAAVMGEICRRFDAFQDRLKGVGYTDRFKELCEAQLPQIFGTGSVGASDTATYCSKLACMAYQATNILADPEFNPAQETPSTLAARTLPVRRFFSLGPELYHIYVCVKRIEWDAELQLAILHQQKLQSAALASAVNALPTYPQQQQHQAAYPPAPPPHQPYYSVHPQHVPIPAAAAEQHQSPLFLDTLDGEGGDADALAPYPSSGGGGDSVPFDPEQAQSVEQLLRLQSPDSEALRSQGLLAQGHELIDESYLSASSLAEISGGGAPPAGLPPPIRANAQYSPPAAAARPSAAEEAATLEWLKNYQ